MQLAFGLNNSQLQSQADSVTYATVSETVTEVSWICTNVNHKNLQTQEKEQTTTTSTSGVVSAVARDSKKQVTGFNLTGYAGVTENSTTDGPTVNSCPTNWALTTPAGDPVLLSSTSALNATLNGVTVTLQ